jgi:anti-anti-sigma regulatory factor
MAHQRRLEIEEVPVTVVRFVDQCLLDPSGEIEEVGEALSRLVETGHANLILDCSSLERVSSAFYSKLLSLRKRLGACGGRLTLTNISPFLREMFALLRADEVFDLRPTVGDALPPKV